MVIDDTVHLSHNCPSFGTQGRLILDIDIDPYYIYRFLYLFSLFYSTGEPAARDQAGEKLHAYPWAERGDLQDHVEGAIWGFSVRVGNSIGLGDDSGVGYGIGSAN